MATSSAALKNPFRFRLSSIFIVVGFFAIGLTALKMATHGWTTTVACVAISLFLAGLIRIIRGPAPARIFWSGFILCSVGYLALLFILHWCDSPPDRSRKTLVNDLITTEALDILARTFNPEVEKYFKADVHRCVFDYVFDPTDESQAPSLKRAGFFGMGMSYNAADLPDGGPFADITASSRSKSFSPWSDDQDSRSPVSFSQVTQMHQWYQPSSSQPVEQAIPPPPPGALLEIESAAKEWRALNERLYNFFCIGHCLFALAFGWIGGMLARIVTQNVTRGLQLPQPDGMATSPAALKNPFRFRLSSIFIVVAFCAIGLTALKMATHGWTIAITSFTAILFLAGLSRITCGPAPARTFWSGFTLCGVGYLALLFILHWCDSPLDRSRKKLANDLITTEALDFLARKFNPEIDNHNKADVHRCVFDYVDDWPLSGDLFRDLIEITGMKSDQLTIGEPRKSALNEQLRYFPRIGHCLFALPFGWIGGMLALILTRRGGAEEFAGTSRDK